ncbi:MAG: amidohydrolase [Candidatus Binataceae bacterium]|nr:amidohydrolase [Candidatus Binataceae bacterium]
MSDLIKAWDADGHVIEWEGTFADKYFDPAFADRKPKVILSNNHVHWLIDSTVHPSLYGKLRNFHGSPVSMGGARYDGIQKKPETLEVLELRGAKARLDLMDAEGIDVSIIYPTLFITRPLSDDVLLEAALCRSYNNWMADVCGESGGRLRWVSVVDANDPAEAAREMARSKKLGAAGVMIPPMVGVDSILMPRYEPIFETAEKVNLALGIHVGYCTPLGLAGFHYTSLMAFDAMIPSGLFDRHPNLRVAFLELGCSWLPWRMERLEERIAPQRMRSRVAAGRPLDTAMDDPGFFGYHAKLEPMEYFRRGNIYVGFEGDEGLLPYCIEKFGAQCFMWASDIPHADREIAGAIEFQKREDISIEDKYRLLVGNASAFYKIPVSEKASTRKAS